MRWLPCRRQKIRVLLADGDYHLRLGLESLLAASPDVQLEQATSTGNDAVDAALEKRPDLHPMESRLSNICSMEATRRIVSAAPGTKVVILSSTHDIETMARAHSAGACSHLAKKSISTDPGNALRMIHSGNMIFAKPTDADRFPPRSASRHDLKSQLLRQAGPRDRRLLQVLSAGPTKVQIASLVHVSEGTVKAQPAKIMEPLGIGNRVQLAVLAVQAGPLEESRTTVPLGVDRMRHATPCA